eukprot:scaffold247032_cov43-Tisochrysis_lutea.AAC.1
MGAPSYPQSTIPTKALTRSILGNPALPTFWKEALVNFRELDILPSFLTREGALSQPIWHNLHFPPRALRTAWARMWETLHANVVHNIFKGSTFTTPYSREECSANIEHLPEAFVHEGRTIKKTEFLNSWDTVVNHGLKIIGKSSERPPPDAQREK